MRLIPASPALLNTIISIAALHQARRQLVEHSSKCEDMSPEPGSRVTTPGHSTAIIDALKHKQLALKNIRNELLNTDPENMVGTIASMLLLVWQDLMDSGTDSWKHHLDALKGIVPTGLLSPKSPKTTPQSTPSLTLYNSFEVTYAAHDIRPKQRYLSTTILYHADPTMMQLCDGQSWAGCPAELLYIIFLVNNISRSQSSPAQLETHIISLYEEFSPMKWAITNQVPRLMKPRFHLASAYKGAVGIYMSQVMNGLHAGLSFESPPINSLDTVIFHLQSIIPSDDHFKSLVWPTFVIGAETQQHFHRAVIDDVFEHLDSIWRCENVRNASIVLRYLWEQNDRRGYTGNWINELYGWGMDWIFI
ncbi:hypothetical protein N7478_011950 [Penicillium angulare]|uniref:uncharacterized protein n=1 Tax=Penicillium angulare TaxID=116970 RepID=UPI002541E199|nr:uncharacterized protein N7478_011950 [Penicillium angulare]KAJ5261355.1 hypothetical protein N7478_011950 [Penicillium angulare]